MRAGKSGSGACFCRIRIGRNGERWKAATWAYGRVRMSEQPFFRFATFVNPRDIMFGNGASPARLPVQVAAMITAIASRIVNDVSGG